MIFENSFMTIVVIGLSSWLGKVWATRINQEENQKFQIQFDAIKLQNKQVFEAFNNATKRYSDKQFELYNELWRSLMDLKISANNLWDKATAGRLKVFAKQLIETRMSIEKSSLLIEEDHYEKLLNIISAFKDFEFNKKNLIDYRNINVHDMNIDDYQINQYIEQNKNIKEDYTSLLNDLKIEFRNQINGRAINKNLLKNVK